MGSLATNGCRINSDTYSAMRRFVSPTPTPLCDCRRGLVPRTAADVTGSVQAGHLAMVTGTAGRARLD